MFGPVFRSGGQFKAFCVLGDLIEDLPVTPPVTPPDLTVSDVYSEAEYNAPPITETTTYNGLIPGYTLLFGVSATVVERPYTIRFLQGDGTEVGFATLNADASFVVSDAVVDDGVSIVGNYFDFGVTNFTPTGTSATLVIEASGLPPTVTPFFYDQ